MGFQTFEVCDAAKVKVGTGVSVTISRGIHGGLPRMRISVTSEVAKNVGWTDGENLVVQIGDGENHGCIRLVKPKSDGEATIKVCHIAPNSKVTYFRIQLDPVDNFVARTEKKQFCQWGKLSGSDGEGIEIFLPPWADETAPGKQKMAGAKSSGKPDIAPRAAKVRAELDAEDDQRVHALDLRNRSRGDVESKLQSLYDLEPRQAQILQILLDKYPAIKRDRIHEILFANDPSGGPDPKMIDVQLSKMRVKLDRQGVVIETLYGLGVGLTKRSRQNVIKALGGAQ